MALDPVFLSRIQFGFVISFRIIFPAFTIGLAAWLATIKGVQLFTGNPLYRRVFDFWIRIFGVVLLGRYRVSPRFYFFACCVVALGTMFSSFWILANNSWMQVPVGHRIEGGKIIPAD